MGSRFESERAHQTLASVVQLVELMAFTHRDESSNLSGRTISDRRLTANRRNGLLALTYHRDKHNAFVAAYEANPRHCAKCGARLQFNQRKNTFCSNSCSAMSSNPVRIRQKIQRPIRPKRIGPSQPEVLLGADFATLSVGNKRSRVVLEQDGRCAGCSLNEWRGRQILLELEHRNGNSRDDRRENLEALCPNCHSQTATWRGRNPAYRNDTKVDDDALLAALRAEPSVARALFSVGMAAKGGNYKRARRLLSAAVI